MSGKATGVFWIGLILIFLNFWLSGQSSALWAALTKPGSNSRGDGTTNIKKGQLAGPLRKDIGPQPNGAPGIGANYH